MSALTCTEIHTSTVAKVSKAQVAGAAAQMVRQYGGEINLTYTAALRGFAVTMPEAAAGRSP